MQDQQARLCGCQLLGGHDQAGEPLVQLHIPNNNLTAHRAVVAIRQHLLATMLSGLYEAFKV